MQYDDINVTDNEAIHHYEMVVEGHTSFIDYKKKGNKIYLIHTEVPEALAGKGVASALVENVLQDIEVKQMQLVPLCMYVQAFLKRHPDWNRLVDPMP